MAQVLARARGVIAKGCHYGLGHGGFDPSRAHPWDDEMLCDCSGFVAWALGFKRHTDHPWYKAQNGGWLETSAIVRDALTPSYGMFEKVEDREARPGDLLVYGDRTNEDGTSRQGHVGIISKVAENGEPAEAVHCSRGNERRYADAIQETPATFWLVAGGIVARCALVDA